MNNLFVYLDQKHNNKKIFEKTEKFHILKIIYKNQKKTVFNENKKSKKINYIRNLLK